MILLCPSCINTRLSTYKQILSRLFFIVGACCLCSLVSADQGGAMPELKALSKEIQQLKQEVLLLNKDLRLLEETLLFPSSTKFSVFVSVSSGQFFTLESVKLKINGELVATHIYSDRQRQALVRGGVQRFHVTNLNTGKHTATAFFTGVGPNGRDYKRAVDLHFEKSPNSGYLELLVTDNGLIQEPVFNIKQW
ncbi:MAG: AraC family transcriptional regulator [Pseudomonadota bacterium]